MGLTVKQLIKELKKMPADARVVTRDHDQGAGEHNITVSYVSLADGEYNDDLVEIDGKPAVIIS